VERAQALTLRGLAKGEHRRLTIGIDFADAAQTTDQNREKFMSTVLQGKRLVNFWIIRKIE
jgi:hypothetical protein